MITDSKQLLDDVICGRRTAERRLGIDIAYYRESYLTFDIGSIGMVQGSVITEDSMTKVSGNDVSKRIMEEGVDPIRYEWYTSLAVF